MFSNFKRVLFSTSLKYAMGYVEIKKIMIKEQVSIFLFICNYLYYYIKYVTNNDNEQLCALCFSTKPNK